MTTTTTTTAAATIAANLIRSARDRAPSFVMLNFIFSHELDAMPLTDDERAQVRAAAREILQKEDADARA